MFEQFFCEPFLEPGDAVLLFSPQFPTYEPNIRRRGGMPVYVPLRQENAFRPDPNDVEQLRQDGEAAEGDLPQLAAQPDRRRGHQGRPGRHRRPGPRRDIAVFSDEPYCHMVWTDEHRSILAEPGMMDQCVGAYTFSKSYSMSGWRLGYAVSSARNVELIGKMINTSLSCVPPIVQLAGQAALEHDAAERDEMMAKFQKKVELLVSELRKVDGVTVLMPAGTFYVFPNVSAICRRLGHHVARAGDVPAGRRGRQERRGVPGRRVLRRAAAGSCASVAAEPDERLVEAVRFFADAVTREERVRKYLEANPKYRQD